MKWAKWVQSAALILAMSALIYTGRAAPGDMPETAGNHLPQDFQTVTQTLNQDFFGEGALSWCTEEVREKINGRSEQIKGDFEAVQEEGAGFPPELIYALEEMIYNQLDKSLQKDNWEEIEKSIYFEVTDRFDAEEFELDLGKMKEMFPELKGQETEDIMEAYRQASGMTGCENMFHIELSPMQDNYVCVEDTGGSAGTRVVTLAKREGDRLAAVCRFETQNPGYGRVIRWEDRFYYIYLKYNYNLKNYDGVCLYRFGEDGEGESLSIKYLPYHYVWENVYCPSRFPELDAYLETMKDTITSDTYLERGDVREISVLCGDERKAESFHVPEVDKIYSDSDYFQADFTNTGIPVYMRKSSFIPSSYNTIWHYKCRFFIQNPEDGAIKELERMEIGGAAPLGNTPVMVQMWFKEIGNKVYTFCLYHSSDYNYVLDVLLLEGGRRERIRTELILPQRRFTVKGDKKEKAKV